MRVTELIIEVRNEARAAAERAAYALGAQGIELRDDECGVAGGRVQVVVWLPEVVSRAAIARVVRAHLALERSAELALRLRHVEATWYSPPRAHHVGRRFVVVPLEHPRTSRTRITLRIPPGLAFGDGLHPTTALCLRALERAAARCAARQDGTAFPRRVLDVGTGSGILAVAAAKLGAGEVVATDIDPLARYAARAMVAANGVSAKVQARLPRGSFDLVVANLYFDPLLALAPDLARRVAEGGALVVSGFTQRAPIELAFRRAGLGVVSATHRAGWRCLELRR